MVAKYMETYAIGDVQGCYDELRRLLDRLDFDPALHRLWLVGDLVNRGPDSLGVLRFVKGLGDAAEVVLGNHELHLIALSEGNLKHTKKSNLQEIIQAPDSEDLLWWLRHRSLMHHDSQLGFSMVHAGLPPQWSLQDALHHAGELETMLRGPDYREYLFAIYGNQPTGWSESLTGMDRLRFITNCLTRLRYCDARGNLVMKEKGPPGTQAANCIPWYAVPHRRTRNDRILFGHWSSLGYRAGPNVWALDSGCIWGGRLTALRISENGSVLRTAIGCDRASTLARWPGR